MITVNGVNYHLTAHGRIRFEQRRTTPHSYSEKRILQLCLNDPLAVWVPSWDGDGFSLITVLPLPGTSQERPGFQKHKRKYPKKHPTNRPH